MKIQNKLFLIFFGFSLVLVVALPLVMQWSIGKGMVDYVNTKEIEALAPLVEELSEEYKKHNSWQSMQDRHNKFRRLISIQLADSDFATNSGDRLANQRPFRGPPQRRQSPDNRPPPPQGERTKNKPYPLPPHLSDNDVHYALLDKNEELIVGISLENLEYGKKDIVVNDQLVGFLAVSKRKLLTQGYEFDFIEQQKKYLWIYALIALGLVTLVTLPLARHVVEPIGLITQGMHKLTQGDYQQTIKLSRQDELGQLSRDYNELAHTLSENETTRKRWLANISHELRTPVAILRGELEAMLDEIRPLTTSNIASANDEVKHLQRLIDDLHQLTSTDIGGMRYQKEEQNLTMLLQGELDKYQSYLSDAGITLELAICHEDIDIYADKTRLCQLFENIINNAIKYSKSTQLKISLTLENEASTEFAKLVFEDNGIGVEESHLSNLFEYLYRVDDSRNRMDGGAGLGLSICRQIVTAHQGEISAQKASLGGLAILIKLPIS